MLEVRHFARMWGEARPADRAVYPVLVAVAGFIICLIWSFA